MNVLTRRTIQYRTDSDAIMDVVLTVFEPFQEGADFWRCGFQFEPPSNHRVVKVGGYDAIAAILSCLTVARGYVEHPSESRTTWQGMPHSGLPWHNRIPEGYQPSDVPPVEAYPGNQTILAKRRLGIPDDSGGVRELTLTVYRPFQVDEKTWKCAFALETTPAGSVRYGAGADFIEALLDALAMARTAYMGMVPPQWEAPESEGFGDIRFLPYRIDRAYSIDRARSDPTPEVHTAG
jgi:hypothetical protein